MNPKEISTFTAESVASVSLVPVAALAVVAETAVVGRRHTAGRLVAFMLALLARVHL